MNNLEQAINLKVKVTTLLDQPTTGYIYAYSSIHEILTLRLTNNHTKSSNKNETYKFINTAFIKTIQVLAPFPKRANGNQSSTPTSSSPKQNSPTPPAPELTQLSINELESTLNKSVKQYKDMISISQNPNASHNATLLFEKLYVNFEGNVKWGPTCDSIIVDDEVKIVKPFFVKSSTITKINPNGSPKKLERVFDLVKEFWQTLENDRIGG